ncbi:transcriptional regulator FeaR [Halomonas sp. KM-1]|uniref:transcriptional regulator FeaR n=1 Tax=Halomonas sp. KM-1 TaxID=590061 RepID=UPI000288F5E0|nr:transcriptional regulator FeaR [Halomonas sp. KM-1]
MADKRHAFSTWHAALRRICGDFEAFPPLMNAFEGNVAREASAGLELARIQTNARCISRRRVLSDRAEDRFCFLIVQRRGRARISQQGQSLMLGVGEMLLMDSARPCEIFPEGSIEHASLHLDRASLAPRLPRGVIPFGKLGGETASGRLLQLTVNRLLAHELGEGAGATDAAAMGDALIALLPPILGEGRACSAVVDDNDMLYRGACQLIDQALQEPELGPAWLAERLEVSLRQLYRLFEARGETVCRVIQGRRLSRCAEALANPGLAQRPITQIAFQWGFTDSAHFSRAFKKAYGESPRAYRQRHCLH